MAAKHAHILDWKERRRWRALDLKHDGWTHHEIAEALGVTKGAVSQWMTKRLNRRRRKPRGASTHRSGIEVDRTAT